MMDLESLNKEKQALQALIERYTEIPQEPLSFISYSFDSTIDGARLSDLSKRLNDINDKINKLVSEHFPPLSNLLQ